MNKATRHYVLGTWALGGMPLFFFVIVYFSYPLFSDQGVLAFNSLLGESVWYLVFSCCLISGVVALVYLPFPYRWLRVGAAAFYLVSMPGFLFVMSLFASCIYGNCV